MCSKPKLIIFSAPSGSGKSTIINYLLSKGLNMEFSISATSRAPRGTEKNGVEYYFLTPEAFRQKIAENAFVEYEEVYADRFYGTLRSEIERIAAKGKATVFDIDVKGGINMKRMFGEQALTLFIQPPSIEELRRRLEHRGTDAPEVIQQRVDKAAYEMSFAPQYDQIIVNDDLAQAQQEAERLIREFLSK